MRLLLLHPPLLSAAVWCRLAPILTAAGHSVVTPDLRPAQAGDWWRIAGRTAIAAAPRAEAVLAHSGAGVLAPVVLDGLPSARAVVLIDAVLPAEHGSTEATPALREAVGRLAIGGVLPPWTSWRDEATLTELVPEPSDRAALTAEAWQLPEAFYDIAVPAPEGWEPAVRGYLQLSPAYDQHAVLAERRGWQIVTIAGRHLDLLAEPALVARAVLGLLAGTA